jgi:hypothetical protein
VIVKNASVYVINFCSCVRDIIYGTERGKLRPPREYGGYGLVKVDAVIR